MDLSAPWDESLDIIALYTVKILPWVNPMGLSIPMFDSLDIISFHTAKIN